MKRNFVKQYKTPERVVQKAIDQLCEYILSTSTGTITSEEYLDLAKEDSSIFHITIDWSLSKKKRVEQANFMLDSLYFVFTTNNKLYKIEKIS